ncbi:hypothetical protein Hbl1158_15570 (plasmid) [Halobaculum sp. CBA1158]|uniref:hypothetical protein n=1 Tax=Halobaculum sp. CBA1158 TaxID=2904243 RepID=UPI001F47FABE|nr:hypothetical protein [Halobaculum sp. CBA1158]UIP01330.1 hypothetical protein Hbl1158_15570 [Halobaculum sp. CBA1158]
MQPADAGDSVRADDPRDAPGVGSADAAVEPSGVAAGGSGDTPTHADRAADGDGVVDVGLDGIAVGGVVALALAKTADVATTLVGLASDPAIRERNPVAAAAMTELGTLPGLVVLGALTVAVTAAVIEGGVRLSTPAVDDRPAGSDSPESPDHRHAGRIACYGVGCACNFGFAVHNAVVVAGVIGS